MRAPEFDIRTVEMHTGGEPVRIVVSGYPTIRGATILDKRRFVREQLDDLRRLLMFEPRGHYDMYGVIPVEPDLAEADLAVLFMHNEGYSTMCGHAVIALGRYAIDHAIVTATGAETKVAIQCPCGLVTAHVDTSGGEPGEVRYQSVPAFAPYLGKLVDTAPYGPVTVDVAYGGAFYALVDAGQLGLDVRKSPTRDLIDAASCITDSVKAQIPLMHPDADDLAFLYGTILTDGADAFSDQPSANVCVFADAQVDRSPTGSGVTARIAAQFRRGSIGLGQRRDFESVTGARFTGQAIAECRVGEHPGVVVEVAGRAHYTGEARFFLEPEDRTGTGFLLR